MREEALVTDVVEQIMFKPIFLAKIEQLSRCLDPECFYFGCCERNLSKHNQKHSPQNLPKSRRLKKVEELTDSQCCPQRINQREFWNVDRRNIGKSVWFLKTSNPMVCRHCIQNHCRILHSLQQKSHQKSHRILSNVVSHSNH